MLPGLTLLADLQTSASFKLSSLDLAILVVYMLLVVGFGMLMGRRQKDASDFMLGEERTGTLIDWACLDVTCGRGAVSDGPVDWAIRQCSYLWLMAGNATVIPFHEATWSLRVHARVLGEHRGGSGGGPSVRVGFSRRGV